MLRKFKFIVSVIMIFMAGTFVSQGQTPEQVTRNFLDRFSSYPLQFSYKLTMAATDDTVMEFGEVVVYKNQFCLTNGSFEVRSDGENVWNVNEDSQEVVIQPADNLDANPILMIRSLDEHFRQLSVSYTSKGGDKVVMATFAAEKAYMGISNIILYINDAKLVAVDFKTKDGISLNVDIPSFTYLNERPSSTKFTYSDSSFGSSWVVTDLR